MSERPGEGEADGVVAGDRGNWGGEEVVEGGGKKGRLPENLSGSQGGLPENLSGSLFYFYTVLTISIVV